MNTKIRKAKALTLVEITITICIIGILAVGIVSLSWDKELTKMYRAENCINEIDGKIKNFMNAALTSKKLTVKKNNVYTGVFPDYYIIEFSKNLNKITFKYEGIESWAGTYEEVLLSGFCKDKVNLVMTGSLPFSTVKMNRGFQQITSNELKTFSLLPIPSTWPIFTGAIQVNLCYENTCYKELNKRIFNTKAQGVSSKKCQFYQTKNSNLCETRES